MCFSLFSLHLLVQQDQIQRFSLVTSSKKIYLAAVFEEKSSPSHDFVVAHKDPANSEL